MAIAAIQNKNTFLDLVILLIGCTIANVPEALVISVILTLSIAAKRLSNHNMLVKNLESVETLGCVNCLLCDKTGTLTKG